MKNQVNLIGYIGDAPKSRSTSSGVGIAEFSVATSERWKDKQTGERKEKTEWHKVAVFNGLSKTVMDHVTKGMLVGVTGKLQNRKWTDKDGIDRYGYEIVADDVTFLARAKGEGAADTRTAKSQTTASQFADDLDDDVPF